MKQEPQSNIINYGLPANMYTKTEAFDQHLFLSKSEAAMHYGPHYHRQRSLGFQPGPTQTELYSHRRQIEAENFGLRK